MNWLERSWYKPLGLSLLLLPLSAIFFVLSWLRRKLFQFRILRTFDSAIPVWIVGNISVGGTGKTPFVIWLAQFLTARGLRVAVISRGYGGQAEQTPLLVNAGTDSRLCGDEPLLIARATGVPVMVGADRKASIDALLKEYQLDVLLSDDGLQHYRMPRQREFCIVDAKRRYGNGWPLPAGPLREPVNRTQSVDLVIENGGEHELNYQLTTVGLFKVVDDTEVEAPVAANLVCGIGNPERFKHSVSDVGIRVNQLVSFPDHHYYQKQELEFNDAMPIIMTEKDAVKCRDIAEQHWYYLKVAALPSKAVQESIIEFTKPLLNHA